MKRWSSILLLVLGLCGCGPSGDPSVEELEAAADYQAHRSSIIGGAVSTGDPAVVAISVGARNQYCTGTLIAPMTVLTAAHCINAYGTSYPYYVLFGTYSWQPTRSVQVIAQYKHPNYNQSTHDIGVLRLAQPVLDVVPIGLSDAPITSSLIGKNVRHVGFGITNATNQIGGGTKRTVTTPLRQYDPFVIESGGDGKQTCSGDSGGPALMVTPGSSQERLAGVVSYGDETCVMYGVDSRVDIDLAWIKNTFAAWEAPTCAQDGKCVEGCAPVDQDCVCATDGVCNVECQELLNDADCPRDCIANGVCSAQACPEPDVDCTPLGGSCGSDDVCAGRRCLTDSQHPLSYCSKTCASPSDCPSDMECASSGVCLFRPRPVVNIGETCALTDYCQGGICTGPWDEPLRCATRCESQAECPMAHTCEVGVDGQQYCRSSTAPVAPRNRAYAIPNGAISAPASGCSSAPAQLPAAFVFFALLGFAPGRRRSR